MAASLIKGVLAKTAGPSEPVDVPRTFIGFLEWIGVTPSAGQAELSRVAFDGVEPVDRDLAARIFGPIDFANLPMGVRRVFVAIVGGRGGRYIPWQVAARGQVCGGGCCPADTR